MQKGLSHFPKPQIGQVVENQTAWQCVVIKLNYSWEYHVNWKKKQGEGVPYGKVGMHNCAYKGNNSIYYGYYFFKYTLKNKYN